MKSRESRTPCPRLPVLVAAVLALLAAPLAGCGRAAEDERAVHSERTKVDPRLLRMAAERPDSVVGVLLRTSVPVGEQERVSLDSAGLVVGSVAGTVATGRIRAQAGPALARLPFVRYVELAAVIPAPPGGTIPSTHEGRE